jgi:hypothetical protein
MIGEYKFGSIKVNGETYNHDVAVFWTGEVLKWQREQSHVIDVKDVKTAVDVSPDTIVIGTGESGVAVVKDEAKEFVKEKGIKLIIDKTEEAIKTFNVIFLHSEEEKGEQDKVVGLFHLTC